MIIGARSVIVWVVVLTSGMIVGNESAVVIITVSVVGRVLVIDKNWVVLTSGMIVGNESAVVIITVSVVGRALVIDKNWVAVAIEKFESVTVATCQNVYTTLAGLCQRASVTRSIECD